MCPQTFRNIINNMNDNYKGSYTKWYKTIKVKIKSSAHHLWTTEKLLILQSQVLYVLLWIHARQVCTLKHYPRASLKTVDCQAPCPEQVSRTSPSNCSFSRNRCFWGTVFHKLCPHCAVIVHNTVLTRSGKELAYNTDIFIYKEALLKVLNKHKLRVRWSQSTHA